MLNAGLVYGVSQEGGKKMFSPNVGPRYEKLFHDEDKEQGQCMVKPDGFRFAVLSSLSPSEYEAVSARLTFFEMKGVTSNDQWYRVPMAPGRYAAMQWMLAGAGCSPRVLLYWWLCTSVAVVSGEHPSRLYEGHPCTVVSGRGD